MKPDTVRLILVRHGEVDANRIFHYLGRRDDDLNETGSKQALALALALAELPIDAVVSSPLRRTLETARRIGEQGDCEVEFESRLIELDFGSWEGHSRTQVVEKSREDQMAIEAWESDSSLATPGGIPGRCPDADHRSRR